MNRIIRIAMIVAGMIIVQHTNAEMKDSINPLMCKFDTPYETVPFEQIKPEHFEPAFKAEFKKLSILYKSINKNKEKPTFENTILPIEIGKEYLNRLESILSNLNIANTSPELQEVAQIISPMQTQFSTKVLTDKAYFKRIAEIYEARNELDLSPEQIKNVEDTYQDMKRNGAGLNYFKKRRLARVNMKHSKLRLEFKANVLAEMNKFELHITDSLKLKGLPSGIIEAAAQTAKKKNKEGWIFTFHQPSYGPFMKYSEERELREQFQRAYSSRCNHGDQYDNNEIIKKLVNLRLKSAKILGYTNYAEYKLEDRMAKDAQTVNQFLEQLNQASKPFAEREIQELTEFAHSLGFEGEIMPWDFSYYSEKLKSNKFGFDQELVKHYFELDQTIQGVFDLSTRLYGLKYKEVDNIQKYHPEVKTYEVYDAQGNFKAIFYADFFPREGKQGGAWMTEYQNQSNINGEQVRPHISICCNFTQPTDSLPSLLTINEVSTFLHEFGHSLHGMLSNTVYPSMSGTNVYRDFVELPSQIMENWVVEPEWLSTFAKHYQTGETIPSELIDKLVDANNFQAGYASERQLAFGISDMAWHTIKKPFKGNVAAFERQSISEVLTLPYVEGSNFSSSFSHIFSGGYACGYYSYKWAEVLDADAFSMFKEDGIFNKETADRFRTEILERGATAHPLTLYKNFRGHEPNIDALLERSGLKEKVQDLNQ